MCALCFLYTPPHVGDPAGEGGGHGRRHQVGAAEATLAPFEIAVRGRSAALAQAEPTEVTMPHRPFNRAPSVLRGPIVRPTSARSKGYPGSSVCVELVTNGRWRKREDAEELELGLPAEANR